MDCGLATTARVIIIYGAMRKLLQIALVSLVFSLPILSQEAAAQSVRRIGDFKDWSTYTSQESGGQVCFIASTPLSSEGNYTQRGKVFAIVSVRPAEDRGAEVSLVAGYPLKPESTVSVDVDGAAFEFFTREDTAWLPGGQELDQAMISAMRRGLTMVVKGTSSRGTLTTDTYSLRGFTAAYGAMDAACRT